ncbi:uncharacterized protein LOC106640191 [Copidosoma floridanum]|uniref:uncharacterized protein LOC106640191 n=1 Tax=Copidosoma floridanum TaxID=29053 RepID=UPI0006C952E8|nr:uncharacterized protein LOC106640191 [Copidosoma floridanum]
MNRVKKQTVKQTGNQDEIKGNAVCVGKRIVDVQVLAQNLKCPLCHTTLSLENILEETCQGLHSIFTILCLKCLNKHAVLTGKVSKIGGHDYSQTNLAAVLGAVHSGVGCNLLNKIFACLNIPSVSKDTYKRYECIVGKCIEEAAKESCKRAAEEERELVIKKVEKLCESL